MERITKKVFEFNDMGGGGEHKTEYDFIYVEAIDEEEARNKFEGELEIDSYSVTCDCCGNDWWVDEAREIETEGKILFIR